MSLLLGENATRNLGMSSTKWSQRRPLQRFIVIPLENGGPLPGGIIFPATIRSLFPSGGDYCLFSSADSEVIVRTVIRMRRVSVG